MKQLLPRYERSPKEAAYLQQDFYQRALVHIMRQSPGAFIIHRQPKGGTQQLRLNFTRAPYIAPQNGNGGSGQSGGGEGGSGSNP